MPCTILARVSGYGFKELRAAYATRFDGECDGHPRVPFTCRQNRANGGSGVPLDSVHCGLVVHSVRLLTFVDEARVVHSNEFKMKGMALV